MAQALATDREVASFDKRGFGESGWSPSKDYSVDANMGTSRDVWQDLAAIKCPTMMVRGCARTAARPRSSRASPATIPIEWATTNSQHDVADQAPPELVAAIRKFAVSA